MAHPTLIFSPGAWHSPEVFEDVISKLKPHGYKCIALPLCAVVNKPAAVDLQPDIAAIRKAVISEIEAENDVVMIAHSWSGIFVSGALENLGKAQRENEGKKGGVVKLAFISAFLPQENISLITAFGGQTPDWYDIKVSTIKKDLKIWLVTDEISKEPWVTVKNPEDIFYHDLRPEDAKYWASRLLPHSYATKHAGASSAAWKTIPSTYLICEEDVAVQENIVKTCREAGSVMDTERIATSHSPFLSKPDAVVGFIRRAAGEAV